MKLASLPRKVVRGLPYLGKELRSIVSDHTPFFVAVPRVVHIWRGAPCNARCIMCDYGFLKGEAYRKLITSPYTDDMIPRTLTEIHELCGRGTLVSYMGGEPTLSKPLLDWVAQASRLGLDFRFTTNGYNMTEEMAAKLVAAGVFNIGVSLESLDPKINEIIRPYPNGTERTLRAIKFLRDEIQRQGKHVSINIKTVLTDINLESFLDTVRHFGNEDGMMYTPQVYEPINGTPPETKEKLYIKDADRIERAANEIRKLKAQGYNIHITEGALKEMVKLYRDSAGKSFTMHGEKIEMDPDAPMCNIGTDNLFVHEGDVRLCPLHPAIGSMIDPKGMTLKQMWDAEITEQVRQGTRECRRLCNLSCLRRTPLTHKVGTFLKIA
jgi:sulfatase maturation enzyme AslB (radical SAM superfamily)